MPRSPLASVRTMMLALLALGGAASFEAAETLAVPDFENRSQRPELEFLGRTLSDALSRPLVESHGFVLVERQRLSEVFKEKTLALSGALGDSASREPLALLAADALVLGSYEGTATDLKVSLRSVRISDARLLGSLSFEGTLESVLGEMKAASDQIEGILHGRPFGFVELESDPSGLEVRIDGERSGKTPLIRSRLGAGAHEIALVSAGRTLWRDSLRLEPGQTWRRRAEVVDPSLRQGVSLTFGTGIVSPRTADHAYGNALGFQGQLLVRRRHLSFGLRGFGNVPLEETRSFDIPYGSRTEERNLRLGCITAAALWHTPQFGPFEMGLGAEGGHLWSRDRRPVWRDDLKERITLQGAFVAGPLLELVWVSGHRLDLLLAGSLPVTLSDWKRDRVVRQDLFPVSSRSNLVVENDEGPLLLPTLDLAMRIHL